MMQAAIGLLALSALGGLVLAVKHIKNGTAPIPLALVHGLLGAAGLVTYVLLVLRTGLTPLTLTSLGLLVTAALGGFVLFAMHLKGRTLPKGIIVLHALLAVGGFLILLSWALSPQI